MMALVRGDGAPERKTLDSGRLLEALQDPDPDTRHAAACGLAQTPGAVTELCEALNRETEPSVQHALINALMSIGDEGAVRCLFAQWERGPFLRNEATVALQQLPGVVTSHLEQLLAAPEPKTRIYAVELIAGLACPSVPEWLARVLRFDTHVNVCACAVNALAECGDADSLPALEMVQERFPDEPFIDFAVERAQRAIAG